VSVLKSTGQPIRIVFDPRQVPRSTTAAWFEFGDASIPAAAIAAVDRDIKTENRRVDASREAHVAAGGDVAKFVPDRTAVLRYLERSIEDAKEPVVRQYLMLRYLQYPEAQSNVAMAQRVFAEIPATSRAWSLLWAGPENTFRRIAAAAHSPSEEQYIATAYETNPDRNVRAAFLYLALQNAFARKDANAVGRLYTRLVGDFGDTHYARQAVQLAPARNIQTGKPVPDFDLASLDDPATRLTPKALTGKAYLVDFWAVWCGPCVAEMPHLHAAHDKFKDKGLVILSVSFDEKDKDVADFRRTKWPMPWFNARLSGFDTDTAKAFEVVAVPKAILVGHDGRILATGSELRGDRLLETLQRVFGGTQESR
jgi:thiol-disulfide isomerase/thioredoxin